MPNDRAERNTNDRAGDGFCTSRANPAETKQQIERIAKRVDDFFFACRVGVYSETDWCNRDNIVVQDAVVGVLVARHLGIPTDVMLDYMPPAARGNAVALADEVK